MSSLSDRWRFLLPIRVLLAGISLHLLLQPCRAIHASSLAVELTGLDEVRANYGLRGNGQSVVIIDTGVAYDHVALGGGFGTDFQVVGGWDFAEDDADPYDDGPAGSHGTHVAGIVGAAEGPLATGVAPGVDLVALRAFNDVGEGSFDWIESALQWVHLHRDDFQFPVTTVNLSLGSAWNLDAPPPSATLEEELSQLETDGIFVAAAAGNEFPTYQTPGLDYPAASPHVVSVMSFDDSGQLSYFSQRQGRAIAAPGRQIVSTVPDYAGNNNGLVDDYMAQSGTNMAAPFLAGASVLIREAMEIVGYTDITQQTIYDDMIGTADLIYDPATEQDYYRINIASAIDALLPEDDFGSTTETAYDMGVVAVPTEITGLISGSNDMDFMTFVAARTGTAFLTTSSSDYLEPDWIVADDESQVLVEGGGDDIVFPVTAGRAYTLGLSSLDGIGHFESTVSIDSMLLGDFNLDGSVSAADYTIWRNTNGSSDDLRADADRSGIVDEADYVLWKQSFSDQPMSLAAPEPSSYMLWIAVLFSTVPIRHRWS